MQVVKGGGGGRRMGGGGVTGIGVGGTICLLTIGHTPATGLDGGPQLGDRAARGLARVSPLAAGGAAPDALLLPGHALHPGGLRGQSLPFAGRPQRLALWVSGRRHLAGGAPCSLPLHSALICQSSLVHARFKLKLS